MCRQIIVILQRIEPAIIFLCVQSIFMAPTCVRMSGVKVQGKIVSKQSIQVMCFQREKVPAAATLWQRCGLKTVEMCNSNASKELLRGEEGSVVG